MHMVYLTDLGRDCAVVRIPREVDPYVFTMRRTESVFMVPGTWAED